MFGKTGTRNTKQETGKVDTHYIKNSSLMAISVGNNITETIFYWHKRMFFETNWKIGNTVNEFTYTLCSLGNIRNCHLIHQQFWTQLQCLITLVLKSNKAGIYYKDIFYQSKHNILELARTCLRLWMSGT